MLYIRQILILFVSLYTVRVVLEVLGVEDYGIYNVVGGVVSLFSFLGGTMASATQRFFSFAIGKNDFITLKRTFNINVLIYIGIALIAVLFLESIGLWYIKTELNIPKARSEAVIWVYQYSILTFLTTILMSPFTAIIIAHEDMQIYAYVSTIEAFLKLCAVFILQCLSWDKLELYGILVFIISFLITMCYIIVCIYRYQECRFSRDYWDANLLREIIRFTGWTLFGQLTTIFRNQALTILLNQMFSPALVTARAIAVNITGQVNMFSNNFNVGLYPPIIKAYAAGDKKEMFLLIFNGSKITFFLMWIFALPFFLEMDIILKIWLKYIPDFTILFTRLALIESLIFSISLPLTTAARAPGNMKLYESVLGIVQIGIFLAAWIILKLGAPAYTVFIVAVIANAIMFLIRLLIVNRLIDFPIGIFIKKVLLPVILISIISLSSSIVIKYLINIDNSVLYSTSIIILCSVLFNLLLFYLIGVDKNTRVKFKVAVRKKIHIYLLQNSLK